jgi:hypothetical protein
MPHPDSPCGQLQQSIDELRNLSGQLFIPRELREIEPDPGEAEIIAANFQRNWCGPGRE